MVNVEKIGWLSIWKVSNPTDMDLNILIRLVCLVRYGGPY